MKKEKPVAFWNLYSGTRDPVERKKLQDEYTQEVIYNLVIVCGFQSWINIRNYFGVHRGKGPSQRIKENLDVLTKQNWGPDPLIKVENGRYVLNDTIQDDVSD